MSILQLYGMLTCWFSVRKETKQDLRDLNES